MNFSNLLVFSGFGKRFCTFEMEIEPNRPGKMKQIGRQAQLNNGYQDQGLFK